MKFQKSLPDVFAFGPIPLTAYELAGTVQHRPLATAILSRLVAGVAYKDHSYTTTTGRVLRIPKNTCWSSIRTLKQDYAAATGCSVSRGEVLGALRWLERCGLISERTLAFPQTNGRYGCFFRLSEQTLNRNEEMVDVLREHRLFTYGPIKDYRFSGRKVEYDLGKYTREIYSDNRQWQKGIESQGFQNAAYRTTGQWRFPDKGNPDAPVFVPWIMVDIDRTSYPDAHEDTLIAAMDFESAGFDESSMFFGFSGSKGFHIALSTGKLGYPIFKSSYDAAEVIATFLRECTNIEFDVSTCNPLQVCRVAGSKNLKSGLYKRMYTMSDFMDVSLEDIYANAKDPGSWEWPRTMIEAEDDMIETLRSGANSVLRDRIADGRKNSKRGWNRIGPTLTEIINGITEGDNFGKSHAGRHKAAFILSCFMLEHPKQLEQVRERLGVNGRHDFENPDCAYATLEHWYRNRTFKATHEVKLKEPFQSAQRTIARKYGRT